MKTRKLFLGILVSLVVSGLALLSATAQLTLTGTNYTEGFESIAGGPLPDGWSCRYNASAAEIGDEIPFTNGVATWAAATIGLPYNMASAHNINPATTNWFDGTEDEATQNAAANRAPGMRLSSGTDGEVTWTLQIADTVGFSDFTVSTDLLVLSTKARSGFWTVDYAVGDAPTSFTPLGTVGDLPGDAFGATNSGVLAIGPEADNQGQSLWIRLALLTDTAPSGTRDTYGIDNFVLNYTGGVVDETPPSITAQPASATNSAGDTAIFTVEAEGAPVLDYQWRKGGVDLGVPSLAALSLADVVTVDAGDYDVVITNAYGAVTSSVATLTVVNDPGLTADFATLTYMPGDAFSLGADVAGTVPTAFQWLKDGVEVGAASGILSNVNSDVDLLVTTDATAADGGIYGIAVSNAVGVATGAVAGVEIVTAPSTRLVSWNFNSLVNDDDTGTGVDTPFVGAGTCFITFDTTLFEYRDGAAVDVADLAVTNDNSGYTWKGVLTGFDKLSGIEVSVDTTGYQDILVSWNEHHNTRASRYMRFQYSTDGVNFIDADGFNFTDLDGSYLLLNQALYGIPGVENNPDFAFRIVAEWESTATGAGSDEYVATATGSSFSAANGVYRHDLLAVWGNPLGTEAPIAVTGLDVSGTGSKVTFSSGPWDVPGEFTLLKASTAQGPYDPDGGAAISDMGAGTFQAETAPGGSQEEYYGVGR